MTLGEKIKFARQLRGMTQKELDLKVGFSESTADNRIRQYEMGKMKPKEDKLELIANALEVDIDALTDMDIGTVAGNRLPHLLFEMERENGLTVQKIGNQFMMSFDSNHETGDFYIESLSAWYYTRKKYLEAEPNNEEALKEYQLWTLEYPFNIMAEEEKISDQIKEMYAKQIASEKKKMKLKTVSDFIRIFEDLSHENIDYNITKNHLLSGMLGTCSRIRLSHSILLELNVASQTAYARFAAAISILQDMNQDMEIQTNSYDNISYDEYNIISSALAPAILGTVKTMQEHFKDGTFTDPDYQLEYQDDLRQFNIPIEDAIHIS